MRSEPLQLQDGAHGLEQLRPVKCSVQVRDEKQNPTTDLGTVGLQDLPPPVGEATGKTAGQDELQKMIVI